MFITEIFGNMFNRTAESVIKSIDKLLQTWTGSPLANTKLGLFEIAKDQFRVLQERHQAGEEVHGELTKLEGEIKLTLRGQ